MHSDQDNGATLIIDPTETDAHGATLDTDPTATDVDAVIIGAGFSGLYMLHRLRDVLGLSVRSFEAGAGVGGTWYWNRYPGARCDTDAYVYCYSFSKELLQEWEWSGKYPEQPEILSYLNHVADRFDLRRSIQFETFVTTATFDDHRNRWNVETNRGDRLSAQFLIMGIGHLSISKYVPKLKGLETFQGEWHHTADWPTEPVDFTGKKVGVIGTGSTGIQAIPVIARQAAHLTVFQRSPQYTVPARHETVDRNFLDEVKANYDEIWETSRWSAGGMPWQHNGISALDVTDDERLATYEALWKQGGFKFALASYRDLALDRRANDTVSEFIRSKIREVVKDPETQAKLMPTDYPFLARRPIIDTNYFETYNRDNVTLADLRHFPIKTVTPTGILTEEGEFELDILVFATGFDAITGPFFNIDPRGRHGVKLTDTWRDGPRGYLGLQTADFPNMFMITGPGCVPGNIPVSVEHHVEWISDCLEYMRVNGFKTVEATREAEATWTAHVNEQAERSLISLADSWFTGANIPGKVRAYVFYFGHYGRYRQKTQDVVRDGYNGFVFDGDTSPRCLPEDATEDAFSVYP